MKKHPCKRCNGTGEEPDQSQIGNRMRAKREAAGKSLRDVGATIGKSAAYLSDLELGRRHWNSEIIQAFEGALQ